MGRYRKIDSRIWNDEKFRDLTDDAKFIFLFLLTHPHLTSLGAMRANEAGLAYELGWDLDKVSVKGLANPSERVTDTLSKGFREPFAELFRKGFLRYDKRVSFLALTNFLKYNPPENPNVVKSWEKSLDLIPECELKTELIARVKRCVVTLPKGFMEGLPEPFRKGMPNQEQEQEQYIEQEQVCVSGSSSSSGRRGEVTATDHQEKDTHTHAPPPDFFLTKELRLWTEKAAPEIDPEVEAEKFLDYYRGAGKISADWSASWRQWIRIAIERQNRPRAPARESAGEHNARIFREIEAEEQAKKGL
jgi:hypothetical protein